MSSSSILFLNNERTFLELFFKFSQGGGGGLLAFLYVMLSCDLYRFSIQCPGSGVVLDCIDS